MLISKLFLKAKYSSPQYSGALVVMLGIVIVLIPEFMKKKEGDKEEVSGQARTGIVISTRCRRSEATRYWLSIAMTE